MGSNPAGRIYETRRACLMGKCNMQHEKLEHLQLDWIFRERVLKEHHHITEDEVFKFIDWVQCIYELCDGEFAEIDLERYGEEISGAGFPWGEKGSNKLIELLRDKLGSEFWVRYWR